MGKCSITSALLVCITLHCALSGMESNEASQPASQEERLIATIASLKKTARLSEQYQWAEEIASYDKSLFCTGEPRKYFKPVEAKVSTISTKLALGSRPMVSVELQKYTGITPFIVGGFGVLCGVTQWCNKSRLGYWSISGLAFLSGAFSAVSGAVLLERYQIVRKLRTSEEMLGALQSKLDAWLTQKIELSDQESEETGSETEETGSDTEEEL